MASFFIRWPVSYVTLKHQSATVNISVNCTVNVSVNCTVNLLVNCSVNRLLE